jgi:hypothetical protein
MLLRFGDQLILFLRTQRSSTRALNDFFHVLTSFSTLPFCFPHVYNPITLSCDYKSCTLGHPWTKFGEILGPDRLRIYLTGKVCLEYGRTLKDERQLPARQGRLAFAYLVCERFRPVTRDELGDAIWPDALPPAWEVAISALVSKLRHLLQRLELPAATLRRARGDTDLHRLEQAILDRAFWGEL